METINLNQGIIIVPHGMRREIALILHVNERTVGRALRGETHGAKSIAVRKLALEKLAILHLHGLVDDGRGMLSTPSIVRSTKPTYSISYSWK